MNDYETTRVDHGDELPLYDAMKLTPGGLKLLELLAFIGSSIPEHTLQEMTLSLLSETRNFDAAAFAEALDDLLAYCLIDVEETSRAITLLEPVQNKVFETLNDDKRMRLFEGVTRKIWSEWPAAMPKPSREPRLPAPKMHTQRLLVSRWTVCDALHPTISRLEYLLPIIVGISEEAKLLYGKLLGEGTWYQKERGHYSEFFPSIVNALRIATNADHPDRDATVADIHFALGSISMDSSDFTLSRKHKLDSYNIIFKICEELGTEDERLSIAYAERAIAWIQDKQYDQGVADIEASIRIMKAKGNYFPQSREANMAWALMGLGKLEECDKLLLESLAAREAVLGKDDRESVRTGLLLSSLAALRALQGNMDESYTYHRQAWAQIRETVGTNDAYTARVAHKVAEHLLRIGKPEEALIVIDQALDAWSVDPLAHHAPRARTTFLKSEALQALGKAEYAASMRRLASELRRSFTSESLPPETLTRADFDKLVAFWSR